MKLPIGRAILSLLVIIGTTERIRATQHGEFDDVIFPTRKPSNLFTTWEDGEKLQINTNVDRQAAVWNVINGMDDYKSGRIW